MTDDCKAHHELHDIYWRTISERFRSDLIIGETDPSVGLSANNIHQLMVEVKKY